MYNVPKTYTNLIKKNIEVALSDPTANPIAAFDADGTCWLSDIGHNFFDYQIKKKFFKDKPYTWNDYKKETKKGPQASLFWFAKTLAGFSTKEVRSFGNDFNQKIRPYFIQHQKEIIKFLINKKIKVYIVTASVKWTVEAAALELGLLRQNVIGIETEIKNGIITNKQKGHISWHKGKVDALLEHTNGKKPFFVSGNTTSDIPMIQISTHLKQIVHSAALNSSIYTLEKDALKIAKKNGWHYMDFIRNDFF